MIRNNRYRHTGIRVKDYIHRNWKIMLMLIGLMLFIALLLVSTIGQYVLIWSDSIPQTPGQFVNPIYILYYGIVKFGWFTLGVGIAFSVCIIKYKIYIDEMDRMYDPRPDCDFMISPTGIYGTNKIADAQELEQFEKSVQVHETTKNIIGKNDDGTVQILLDKYKGKPIGIGPHKFVSGASGSWKTSSVFLPDIMQGILQGVSMICTDPKGELRLKCTKMAQKYDYITKELNTINPFLSDGIDILKLIKTYADARTLTDIIMQNTEDSAIHKEDFWAKGERAAICFSILYVLEAPEYKGRRHFSEAFAFLRSTPIAEINDRVELLPESSSAKKQWEIFQTTPENSQGGIITGVMTRLAILNDPVIARIVDTDDIDIVAPGQKKCIYFVIVSDNDPSNNLIAAMFFSLLFNRLIREADSHLDQKLKVPVVFELDEMMNIGKIPNFTKMLSVIRSRDMRCTICTQDIGQLQDAYPGKLWANIIGNCDTKVMLGVNDSEVSAPYWSKCTGVMTIIAQSTRETVSRFKVYTRNDQIQMNEGTGKREVFTPAEIMKLPNEYQLVFFRGHNVQMIKKFSYFDHPMYKEIDEELYTEHEPSWWRSVADEMKNAKNADEYEWFVTGMTDLRDYKENIEREREEKRKKEKIVEKKTETMREYNSGNLDFKTLSIADKLMVVKFAILNKYAAIYNSLHNITKDQNEQLDEDAVAETYTESDNFEEYDSSYDEVLDNDGYLDDNTLINTDDEDYDESNITIDSEPQYDAADFEPAYDEPNIGEPDIDEPDFGEPNFDEPSFEEPEEDEELEDSPVGNSKLEKHIDKHFKPSPKKLVYEQTFNIGNNESLMSNVKAIHYNTESNRKEHYDIETHETKKEEKGNSVMSDIFASIEQGQENKRKKEESIKSNIKKGMKGI